MLRGPERKFLAPNSPRERMGKQRKLAYLVVAIELLNKLFPVLFAVVHTIKSCLTNVRLDPAVFSLAR